MFNSPLLISTVDFICPEWFLRLRHQDSIIVGYLKYCNDVRTGMPCFEVWKTKKDKDPQRILKKHISDYCIGKDTFKILLNFTPYFGNDTYFDMLEIRTLSRGKVNLYIVKNINPTLHSYSPDGRLGPPLLSRLHDSDALGYEAHMYLVEDPSIGYIRALPSKKEKLFETLSEFFPDQYLIKYSEHKGKIKYSVVPDLVRLYNSR